METTDFALPPPEPPPLISDEQIISLSFQGHLHLQLPPSLLILYQEFATASATLFERSLQLKYRDYPSANRTDNGYTYIEGEKQYITFRFATKAHPDRLEQLAGRVWQESSALLHRVLVDLARGMGLAYGGWDPILDGCLSMPTNMEDATPTQMRTFQYSPNSGIAEMHSDLGLLTLCVGFGKGLQVLVREKDVPNSARWVDVEGPTLFIGQVLRTLSGKRLRAGLHRVVANPAGRQSIVFALRPSLRHDHTDLTLCGGEGTRSMSQLWAEIRGSKFSVNAERKLREEQKEHILSRNGKSIERDKPRPVSFNGLKKI